MNPYLNSLNGWGGGFIAFWPSGAVVIAAFKSPRLFMKNVNRMMNP